MLLPHRMTGRCVALGMLGFGLALVPAGCARQPVKPNVLVIVIDTLRADRVGGDGYARETTPRLDEFARDALRFTHLQSPRAKTTPAVASLMTGLYPHDHGVRDLTTPLPREVRTLAQGLSRAGWRTGAIVGNFVLKDELSGLSRGFDSWTEDFPDLQGVPPSDVPQRKAASITEGALRALALGPATADGAGPARPFVREGMPWFLYLHYMDPHGLYDPPAEFARFADQESAEPQWIPPPGEPGPYGLGKQWIAEYNVLEGDRDARGRIDASRVIDRYDGEVLSADAQIGRLLDALRAKGLLENTIVLIVADHGESLGEHDYWFEHGRHAYEATCRVPGILRLPESLRAALSGLPGDLPAPGLRNGDLSLCDLAPTILDILRLPRLSMAGAGPRGTSRTRLLMDDEGPRPVFCEKIERAEKSEAVQTKAVRLGDWKFVRRYTHLPDSDRPGHDRLLLLGEQLYDLRTDPSEAHDLSAAPPASAPLERLRAELLRFSAADEHFSRLARELQERREALGRDDPETLRILRALGY